MIENKTAIISDIQRFSVDDGPGIRTTVFFKGCNLKCAWCHNPETQNFHKELLFYAHKCRNCGLCKKICPYSLEKCDVCGKCEDACPNGARVVSGKIYTVNQLVNELVKDKVFYKNSNGGVTFSGGECLLFTDFVNDAIVELKKQDINVAIDTAGNVNYVNFQKIINKVDLFLYDVKIFDDQKHVKYVGASNRLILENLKKLIKDKARIWIRIPIIKGVNDNSTELKSINNFIKAVGEVERVELLPYHSLGESKYQALNREAIKFEKPNEEVLKSLLNCFDFPTYIKK